jgi:hypothetical protein
MEKTVTQNNGTKEFTVSIQDKSGIGLIILAVVLGFLVYGEPDVMDALVEITRNWILG